MKDILLGSMLAAILLTYGTVVYGQDHDLYGNRRTNPVDLGSQAFRAFTVDRAHHVFQAPPDSHTPPRSRILARRHSPVSVHWSRIRSAGAGIGQLPTAIRP